MDNKLDIVTLIDEEGDKFEFEVVDYFWVNELEYAVLLPLHSDHSGPDEDPEKMITDSSSQQEAVIFDAEEGLEDEEEENGEAIILRVVNKNNGETTLEVIEDEDEWQKVADIALERIYDQDEKFNQEEE